MAEQDFSKPYYGRRNLGTGSAVAHQPVAASRQSHPYGLRKRSIGSASIETGFSVHDVANGHDEGESEELVQDELHIQWETRQSRPELNLGNLYGKRFSLPFPQQVDNPSPLASRSTDSELIVPAPARNLSPLGPSRDPASAGRAARAADSLLANGTSSTLRHLATRSLGTPQTARPASSSREWPLAPARRPPPPIPSKEQAAPEVRDAVSNALSREASVAPGDMGNPPADPFVDKADLSDCIWVGGPHDILTSHSSSSRATAEPPTRRRTSATPTAASSRPQRTRKLSQPQTRRTTRSTAGKLTRTSAASSSSHATHWQPYSAPSPSRLKSPISTEPPPIPALPSPSSAPALQSSASSTGVQTFSTTPLAEAAFINGQEERAELVRLYKKHSGNLSRIRGDLLFGRSRPTSDTERWLRILADVEQEGNHGVTLHERHRARLDQEAGQVVQDAVNVDAGARQEEGREGRESGDHRAPALGSEPKATRKRKFRGQWMPHELDSGEEEHEGDSDAWSTDRMSRSVL